MVEEKLSLAQVDRACGVLLGGATGDALGAGYEFRRDVADVVPAMIGGGLGDFEPGEWTDDTAQAVAIALAAADGLDLRTPDALDRIAQSFADWYADGPADIGIQTRDVLSRAGRHPSGAAMVEAARQVHERSGRSAGNGSLMRTGPVVLAHLHDPVALVEAAQAVSALTHHETVAGEACAVWCLMIRHAVLSGELPQWDDIAQWVPRPTYWREVLAEAEAKEPGAFVVNGWAVGALQAAWSAITHTPVPEDGDPCGQFADVLTAAIRIGNDTDTVAAIAGALIGARWGMTAIPTTWRRMLHGWPGISARGLEKLAYLAAHGGRAGQYGWPLVERVDYRTFCHVTSSTVVAHPHDDGVLLANVAALDALPDGVDAVVSLCLTGHRQITAPDVEQVTFRLLDFPEAAANPNLDHLLVDAARTVAALRAEGKRVLLHCVAAQSRTPAVAIAYALGRGVPLDEATDAVVAALPAASPNHGFRAALRRIEQQGGLSW